MSRLRRAEKVVEVTGLPGIGKSMLCAELTTMEGYSLFNPRLALPWRYSAGGSGRLTAVETLLGRLYLAFLGVVSIKPTIFFKIIAAVQQQQIGTFGALRVVGNVLQKLGLPIALGARKGGADTLIIDEGYSHIFYNLGLSDPDLLKLLIYQWQPVDIVLCVEGPTKKVREQLMQRGHWRLDMPAASLADFMQINLDIQAVQLAALKSVLGERRLVRVENSGDKGAHIRQLLEELTSHEKQTTTT